MPEYVFVDESIHERLGFIVVALVAVSNLDVVARDIASALRKAGLKPGIDEAKWSAYVSRNPESASLRRTISQLVLEHSRVGIVVAATAERPALLPLVTDAVTRLAQQGQLGTVGTVVVDQGLADPQTDDLGLPSQWAIRTNQNSKAELGLQLADAAAGEMALVLRYQLGGIAKFHAPRGEGHDGEDHGNDPYWAVGNLERMEYRYNLFGTEVMEQFAAGKEPFRNCIDSGVFFSPGCPPDVRTATERAFGRLYLGCMA